MLNTRTQILERSLARCRCSASSFSPSASLLSSSASIVTASYAERQKRSAPSVGGTRIDRSGRCSTLHSFQCSKGRPNCMRNCFKRGQHQEHFHRLLNESTSRMLRFLCLPGKFRVVGARQSGRLGITFVISKIRQAGRGRKRSGVNLMSHAPDMFDLARPFRLGSWCLPASEKVGL